MKIEKIDLEYVGKDGFTSTSFDAVQHTKSLPYLSVVQAVEGSYDIRLGSGALYNTGRRGFFIAPSNVMQTITHNADPARGRITCRWIYLSVKINRLYQLDSLYDFPTVVPDCFKEELHTVFDRLFSAENKVDEYIAYYQIVKLLFQLATEKAHTTPAAIEKILQYITAHYHEPITARELAQAGSLSESYLFSCFKKETGISPIAYLNNYRLSIAAAMLLNTDKSIVEIATEVGIGDSVYFNKLFRRTYQVSPSKYRKLHQTGRN